MTSVVKPRRPVHPRMPKVALQKSFNANPMAKHAAKMVKGIKGLRDSNNKGKM